MKRPPRAQRKFWAREAEKEERKVAAAPKGKEVQCFWEGKGNRGKVKGWVGKRKKEAESWRGKEKKGEVKAPPKKWLDCSYCVGEGDI